MWWFDLPVMELRGGVGWGVRFRNWPVGGAHACSVVRDVGYM